MKFLHIVIIILLSFCLLNQIFTKKKSKKRRVSRREKELLEKLSVEKIKVKELKELLKSSYIINFSMSKSST